MNVETYLERFDVNNVHSLDFSTLYRLQRNHLLYVPFENLDVIHRVPIPLDVATYYRKVVTNRRGGFCYELNGLFHWLLTSLGYDAKLIAATVRSADGSWTMTGSHAAQIVQLDQPYFVDVGFGDSARKPLPLTGEVHRDVSGTYRILPLDDDTYDLQRMNEKDEWVTRLRFSLAEKQLVDFEKPCHFNQTSPNSHFTGRELATIATEEGRITLSGNKLTITKHGKKTERIVTKDELAVLLRVYFGIALELERL